MRESLSSYRPQRFLKEIKLNRKNKEIFNFGHGFEILFRLSVFIRLFLKMN